MPTYQVIKNVPIAKLDSYTNNGWLLESQHDQEVKIIKNINTHHTIISHSMPSNTPTYLQRGIIQRPLSRYKESPLEEAVTFGFMNHPNFEFGALTLSILRTASQSNMYRLHKCTEIAAVMANKSKHYLQIYSNFDTKEQETDYLSKLHRLFHDPKNREKLGLDKNPTKLSLSNTDFWWDIENDIFLSFDAQFMVRLSQHLNVSFHQ